MIEMKNITKTWPGVTALNDVNLEIKKGEIHALIGENGAGKSTLMKILRGVHSKDSGKILYNDKEILKKPHRSEAHNHGISMVFQELSLFPDLSVTENLFLEEEENIFRWNKFNDRAKELLSEFELDINPNKKVKCFSMAVRQLIEIAKSINKGAETLILDEPTSSLSEHEIKNLFKILRKLKSQGKAIIFIGHSLTQIFEIAEVFTVLRDGNFVKNGNISDYSEQEIIKYMVGREISDMYPDMSNKDRIKDEIIMRVEKLNNQGLFEDVSFDLKKGEVFGIAGLMGSGRTEVVKTIFGGLKKDSGKIFKNNQEIKVGHPKDAIENGIALLTEDRQSEGLILNMEIKKNISLVCIDDISPYSLINKDKENDISEKMISDLKVSPPDINRIADTLSGGNQQKVVFAKWLSKNPDILILDEPTRGIDVGAKKEIYEIIKNLVTEGKSVIFISSELPEVIRMCDRVLVMNCGQNSDILTDDEICEESIMYCATCDI